MPTILFSEPGAFLKTWRVTHLPLAFDQFTLTTDGKSLYNISCSRNDKLSNGTFLQVLALSCHKTSMPLRYFSNQNRYILAMMVWSIGLCRKRKNVIHAAFVMVGVFVLVKLSPPQRLNLRIKISRCRYLSYMYQSIVGTTACTPLGLFYLK